MKDPDGDYAGNLFITLKWKTPYKKRSVPMDPPLPIVTSTTLINDEPVMVVEEEEEEVPLKKKNSARETLESYFNERQSDRESLPDKTTPTPPPVETEYATPPPPPKTPEATTPSQESVAPTPVPLDQTLDSIPIEDNNDEEEVVEEEKDEIEEEIIEEDIQSGSVSFNIAEDSGLSDTAPVESTEVLKEYTPVVITIKRLEAIDGVEERPNSTFVEYEFCGKVKETSASLPFPTVDKPALFDYTETFKFTVRLIY